MSCLLCPLHRADLICKQKHIRLSSSPLRKEYCCTTNLVWGIAGSLLSTVAAKLVLTFLLSYRWGLFGMIRKLSWWSNKLLIYTLVSSSLKKVHFLLWTTQAQYYIWRGTYQPGEKVLQYNEKHEETQCKHVWPHHSYHHVNCTNFGRDSQREMIPKTIYFNQQGLCRSKMKIRAGFTTNILYFAC